MHVLIGCACIQVLMHDLHNHAGGVATWVVGNQAVSGTHDMDHMEVLDCTSKPAASTERSVAIKRKM